MLQALLLALFLAATPLLAQEREVDLELVLAVDVSRSMSPHELELQRRGYAEALASGDVVRAIEGGLLGRIALTYFEWAGTGSARVVVPWTEISTAEDARKVAALITAQYEPGLRRTSISSALRVGARAMRGNGFAGLRRVIDISGDGPNNMGLPVLTARAEVLAEGITINGLPLMTTDALSEIWGIPDLDLYYTHCVIGGPGAFVVPVLSWHQFPDAVRRKLVQEIASTPEPTTPRLYRAQGDYDCFVGEKMWAQNRPYIDIP